MTDTLLQQIDTCALVDRHWLRARLRKIGPSTAETNERRVAIGEIENRIARSRANCDARWGQVPRKILIPEELPIADRENEIVQLLTKHQVIVVAGETGSGKTTQLPKLCLKAGFGKFGLIGHTQPRRLAAISVANRIAEELGTEPGAGVGYQVRFNDSTSPSTYLKLMTDGILLAEIQQDKFLNKYEVLIIDEAHERSLNIDFLLGYLRQLLPRRPELKIIITSATIDVEKFSEHFSGAPVVSVSGRTFPVTIRYAPIETPREGTIDDDLPSSAIIDAVQEINRLDKTRSGPRDVLVFLSSEKEIRETALKLRQQQLPDTEVLPLYARLRHSEQLKIFRPHSGRRIILATNIAETSLTVPGIRYVIDTGTARISRYSVHSKIQRLPIEPISQASANQRAGRCGRVSAGICIRLYSETDYTGRPEFTDPEIKRTNLAAVILQMISLKIGDVEKFPFLEKPESKAINDGYKLLYELGAIDEGQQLTRLGRDMSRLPVDPRFARMLIAAGKNSCLREVAIIVSALSIQDPRETPAEKRQQAQEKHARFAHPDSDFLAFVKLWDDYEQRRQDLTQAQLRKYCNQNFLSFMRMREWRETHRQLITLAHQLKLNQNKSEACYRDVHGALLSGSLNQVACRSEGSEYLGSRNRKFRLLPMSVVARKPSKWIISGQVIETAQTFASAAAKVEPEWIETAAAHLTRKSWSEPHWSKKQQRVMALEKVSLYGLVIIEKRIVGYSDIDPGLCRSIFIREALVGQQLDADLPFYRHNRELLESIEKQEEKLRKQSYFLDERQLENYYEERIPESVNDSESLRRWYAKQSRSNAGVLKMRLEDLIPDNSADFIKHEFPDRTTVHNNALKIDYQFDPGSSTDGATIEVPSALLGQISQGDLDWAVPGQLKERCLYLLKSLPKATRKNLIPLSAFVDQVIDSMEPHGQGRDLLDELREQTRAIKGVEIERKTLEQVELPVFLKIKIKVVDEAGKILGAGSDLEQLRRQFMPREASLDMKSSQENESLHELECDGLTDWSLGDFPEQLEVGSRLKLIRYPALLDKGDSVSVRLLPDKKDALLKSRSGLVRLFMLRTRQQRKDIEKQFESRQRSWGLKIPPFLSGKQYGEAFAFAVYSHCFDIRSKLPRNHESFEQSLADNKANLYSIAEQLLRVLDKLVAAAYLLARLPEKLTHPHQKYLVDDIGVQLECLLSEDLLLRVDLEWIKEIPRYLQAIEYRIERSLEQPARDQQNHELVNLHWRRLLELGGNSGKSLNAMVEEDPVVGEIRWMIEEYRVSLFAQQLKTKIPVSDKRLEKLWLKLRS